MYTNNFQDEIYSSSTMRTNFNISFQKESPIEETVFWAPEKTILNEIPPLDLNNEDFIAETKIKTEFPSLKSRNKENLFVKKKKVFSPLKKFAKMQENQYKYFENLIHRNKVLEKKNEEYAKKIETLNKEVVLLSFSIFPFLD